MRQSLPAGLHRIRLSTLVLAVTFVGLFALWVMVRTPSDGSEGGFTPLGAAASAAHLHLPPTPTATPTPKPTPTSVPTASPTPTHAPKHAPYHVSGGAAPASSGHAPAGGS